MKIKTAAEVIDALGGTAEVAAMLGVTYDRVFMWRVRGLPPTTFLFFQDELEKRDLWAPYSIWRQMEKIEGDHPPSPPTGPGGV